MLVTATLVFWHALAMPMFIPLQQQEDLRRFGQAEAQLTNPLLAGRDGRSPKLASYWRGRVRYGGAWPKWEQSGEALEPVFRRLGNASFDIKRYRLFARRLQAAVAETGVAPVYVIESASYFVEHLMPLFLAGNGSPLFLSLLST